VADRFKMSEACFGMLARFQPFIDRTLDVARGGQVMGQEFGPALNQVGKILL
jgi:hypothetical protein